jgi:hypothetical protein
LPAAGAKLALQLDAEPDAYSTPTPAALSSSSRKKHAPEFDWPAITM